MNFDEKAAYNFSHFWNRRILLDNILENKENLSRLLVARQTTHPSSYHSTHPNDNRIQTEKLEEFTHQNSNVYFG